jgi:hypothetical protein
MILLEANVVSGAHLVLISSIILPNIPFAQLLNGRELCRLARQSESIFETPYMQQYLQSSIDIVE